MSDLKRTSLRRSQRVKKTTALILGYTRAGRSVLRPTRAAPDMNNDDAYSHAKEKLADWTRGEHKDASRILQEHGEREPDAEIATWCTRWAIVHRDLGGRRGSSD